MSTRAKPSHPNGGGRSPTMMTPSNAAVSGSLSDNVVAVVDLVVSNPLANRR
jgi:hypothetical protein